MITFVAQTINWCVAGVLSVLTAAAIVGQTIVTVFAGILNGVAGVFRFFADVCEDNRNLFTLEFPSMVLEAPGVVFTHFYNAADAIASALSGAYATVVDPVFASAYFFFSNFMPLVFTIKRFVIITGDSLWLIITFIPIHLPTLLGTLCWWIYSVSSNGIVGVTVRAYSMLLRFTNFLTDVPLQSMLGIVLAIIFVRLIVEFQVEIKSIIAQMWRWSVRRFIMYYYSFYHYLTNDEVRIITELTGEQLNRINGQRGDQRDRRPRQVNPDPQREPTEEGGREALCVVCQERQKCVLILPCRHICLCCECCERLSRYQRTCPICRTFIYHSATVYL